MPHSASAKKRLRQNVRSRDRNRAVKSEMKTAIRKVLEAISEKDVDAAKTLFHSVAKKADRLRQRRQFIKIKQPESSRDSVPELWPHSQRQTEDRPRC
jgi:small subunit ribosomal protein S20